MALIIAGQGGQQLQIDTKHRAARVSQRPIDVGANGAFRIDALSGQIAASLAANSPLFSFRWTDATRKCVLTDLQVGIIVDGTITTAVAMALEAVIARSFTVSDTGGTTLTIAGNNGKMQTTMASTLTGDARIASTGTLSAGTRTLDAQGFGMAIGGSGTTAGAGTALAMTSIYRPIAGVEPPVVFDQNEGFIIRNMLTGPASGTWRFAVMAAWAEVASYNNAVL